MIDLAGSGVPVSIPLSQRSAGLVRLHAVTFGGVSELVRAVVLDAQLRGAAPDPTFSPNGERLTVRLPQPLLRVYSGAAVGSLVDLAILGYDRRRSGRPEWRSPRLERVRMEVSGGSVSRHLRMQALQAGESVEERASRLAQSFINASFGTLHQMAPGEELIDVWLPRGWYREFRRRCREVDLVADDVLSYGIARTVLGGFSP